MSGKGFSLKKFLKDSIFTSISWLNEAGTISSEMDPLGVTDDQDPSQSGFSLHVSTGSSDAEKRLTPPPRRGFFMVRPAGRTYLEVKVLYSPGKGKS